MSTALRPSGPHRFVCAALTSSEPLRLNVLRPAPVSSTSSGPHRLNAVQVQKVDAFGRPARERRETEFGHLMAFGALEGAAAPATFVDVEALEQFGQEPLDARSIAACL